MQLLREGLGPDIDIGIDFHAKTSPSVASIIVKEVEPLNLLFIEEPCPPENVKAMARIARRSTTPIATGERLVAHYGCRELIEMGVVDIMQTDINHVGGITALWKVGQMAGAFRHHRWRRTPAKARSADSPRCTSMPPCPTSSSRRSAAASSPPRQEKVWEEWLGFPAMRMVGRQIPAPDKPGLGFDLSEERSGKVSIRRHPAHGARLSRGWLSRRMVMP